MTTRAATEQGSPFTQVPIIRFLLYSFFTLAMLFFNVLVVISINPSIVRTTCQ
jgi:hypothetical protein